jgi:hypothetical protein
MNVLLLAPILWGALSLALTDGSYTRIQTPTAVKDAITVEAQLGKFLVRVKEPRLPDLTKDVNAEVYRMMIFPTWGNAILVRVQRRGIIYSLSARRTDGQAGFEQGKLVEAKDVELSEEDSRVLEQKIQNLQFFDMAVDDGVLGMDGDEWILEGVSQGKYHVARRWCASSYKSRKRGLTAFISLCKFLVDKSELSQRPKNKGQKLI